MNEKKFYPGINYFRILAAVLVVAVHTSPFLSYSEMADFIFTRIVARIAVPFFFMTSGFFLFLGYSRCVERLKGFVKKMILLYVISILIYIPVNIYNGYLSEEYFLVELIKDLIFDGTLYHLWYFPASILGACISWYLIRKWGYRISLIICGGLYIVGLFGDSYYGISEQILAIKQFYFNIFLICDYTRNGIFFAPIFFVLGGFISKSLNQDTYKKHIILSVVCFALMIGEGILLHKQGMQRHDSMYIMLIPFMYSVFSFITNFKERGKGSLPAISLYIYIIHPMVIVLVRMLAKVSGLQEYLIDNSLLHYIMVLGISVIFSVLLSSIQRHIITGKRILSAYPKDRAWVEIDLNNLWHNATILQEAMPDKCELMAVVKANAYGHGSVVVSEYLEDMGVKTFAVATLDEGIELRKHGIKGDILIMGYTHISRAKEIQKYCLIQSVFNFDYAAQLNESGYHIRVHIKIDTGMHRLGIESQDICRIKHIFEMKYLKVCGIYTHLCSSDSFLDEDISFTKSQIRLFYELLDMLHVSNIDRPKIHIQSSYGFMNYPNLECDYVRAGISLYGTLSQLHDTTCRRLDLHPVLTLKSRVAHILEVKEGEGIGYGRAFTADRNMRIAVLSIGYADGIPRTLSNGGRVIINGEYSSIVGRICMDQVMVDVTNIQGVSLGDTATLIGKDKTAEIKATEISENTDSITNEVLSRLGSRLKAIYNE